MSRPHGKTIFIIIFLILSAKDILLPPVWGIRMMNSSPPNLATVSDSLTLFFNDQLVV